MQSPHRIQVSQSFHLPIAQGPVTFGSIRSVAEQIGDGPIEARQAVVHVTQRLALSPAATIELINGLKQTLTTLTQMRKQSQGVTQQ